MQVAGGRKRKRVPKALILAAGEGTRLRPLTLDRPKPMLPIAGRPLLEHTIEWLRSHGIAEIAINLHHQPQTIVEHFGDGSRFGVQITYSHEDPILGTAGAAKRLQQFFDATFVVIYGDVLTDLNLAELIGFHRHKWAAVTAALYRVENPSACGLVGIDDSWRITRFVEKPPPDEVFTDLANAGVLALEPWVLSCIPPDTFYDFGHHLLPDLLASGLPLYGYPISDTTYLIDIGTPEKYERAQREWPAILQQGP